MPMSAMVVHEGVHQGVRARVSYASGGLGLLARTSALLRRWQQRSVYRAHLAELDTRLLTDIGLTPDDAARESAKPFWRA
jgi:uncharacterized protein YjiS (DUF1127 family)